MITIISKGYCPYCASAKQLISGLGFEYKEIDVTIDSETLQKASEFSGMRTVPQVFAGEMSKESSLWGFDDISALHDAGKLVALLEEA